MTRLVIFDLDGTLVDAFDGIHDALTSTMQALGFAPLTFEETKQRVGHGLETLLASAMTPGVVEKALPLYRERYAQIAVSSARLLPGAGACTSMLVSRGILLALASNKASIFSKQILEGLGILNRFALVLGPDLVSRPKPDPVMLNQALASLGVAREEALYVGDMEIDVEVARRAGIRVACVPSGARSREALAAERPDYLLGSLEELPALV